MKKSKHEEGALPMEAAAAHPPDTLNEIGVLKRREIEARILAPLLDALGEEFDRPRVLEITRRTITQIALRQGAELAARTGGDSLIHFAAALEDWQRGGAMDIEILEHTSQRFDFNVTRCAYAELYSSLGNPELGELLSCNRDRSLISGFNPGIRLQRTQTIMQGASFCDFRYINEEAAMKTLLILRHAKSSWEDEKLPDIDRPLNKRGRHDAPRIGDLIKAEGLLPDLIISSTAKRTRSTVELVAGASDYDGEIRWDESLYAAEPQAYITALRALPAEVERVMVVGHNPGLEELVAMLTDEWARLPTAALAQVSLDIANWSDLEFEPVGKLVHVWRPKELAG
jgi:phosphohistidine phosphatase SixA